MRLLRSTLISRRPELNVALLYSPEGITCRLQHCQQVASCESSPHVYRAPQNSSGKHNVLFIRDLNYYACALHCLYGAMLECSRRKLKLLLILVIGRSKYERLYSARSGSHKKHNSIFRYLHPVLSSPVLPCHVMSLHALTAPFSLVSFLSLSISS